MTKQNFLASLAIGLCFVLAGFYSCKNSSSESKNSEDKDVIVTEAFDAQFTGDYTYMGPDTLDNPKCPDSLTHRIIVDCKGTSNIMGNIIVHFDFCANEKGYYGNNHAYMVDENNDTLFISCAGRVIEGRTDAHPDFVTEYWKDDFEILGGTGKYEGATGGGKTDDYNSAEDPNSHHNWKGTLQRVKKRV